MSLTRTDYDAYVNVPASLTVRDEPGRLWYFLWLTR